MPVRLVDCADWRKATPSERTGVIRQIRSFAGGPTGTPGVRGSTIPDDKAYELFQSYCRNRFATHFKLYKLYTRAAAFRGSR